MKTPWPSHYLIGGPSSRVVLARGRQAGLRDLRFRLGRPGARTRLLAVAAEDGLVDVEVQVLGVKVALMAGRGA